MKPGIRTSESWIALVTMVVGGINEAFGRPVLDLEGWVIFAPGVAYVVSRGLAKMNAPATEK